MPTIEPRTCGFTCYPATQPCDGAPPFDCAHPFDAHYSIDGEFTGCATCEEAHPWTIHVDEYDLGEDDEYGDGDDDE